MIDRTCSICFSVSAGVGRRMYSIYFMPFVWNWGTSTEQYNALTNGVAFGIGPIMIAVQD